MSLNYGDANTKYFHLKTLQHHSHSRIVTFKDETGLWPLGEALTTHILAAFKRLFMTTSVYMQSTASLGQQYIPPHSPLLEHSQWLSSTPQTKKISQNVLSLPPLKVLGPDDYHAIFFSKRIGTFYGQVWVSGKNIWKDIITDLTAKAIRIPI